MREGAGFFLDGRRGWGFDVTMEAKKFSGRERWLEGRGEEMWQQKFVLLWQPCPDHCWSSADLVPKTSSVLPLKSIRLSLLCLLYLLVIASLCFRKQVHVLVECSVKKIFVYFLCANFMCWPLWYSQVFLHQGVYL